jgi:hypothetical protein
MEIYEEKNVFLSRKATMQTWRVSSVADIQNWYIEYYMYNIS